MRGFGFRTLPNYPPESEWLFMTAIVCLCLPISVIVIALTPSIDPFMRALITFVAWWFTAVTAEGVRQRLARARGIPFVADWDYAEIYYRWGLSEPLWVQWLRIHSDGNVRGISWCAILGAAGACLAEVLGLHSSDSCGNADDAGKVAKASASPQLAHVCTSRGHDLSIVLHQRSKSDDCGGRGRLDSARPCDAVLDKQGYLIRTDGGAVASILHAVEELQRAKPRAGETVN
jgi:hypothetical protein